jgi:poly(3-hydroxybutyrate) depolymerase
VPCANVVISVPVQLRQSTTNMTFQRAITTALLLGALMPAPARAQALPGLSTLRVGYNTQKNTLKPEGVLKAQIEEVDTQIAEASRLGQTSELRRLYAKGRTLLSGRPWTDVLEYTNSLALRTERVVADSAKPYPVRVGQIYRPSIELQPGLRAHATLQKRAAAPAAGASAEAPATVKDFGFFDDVSRDLLDSPFPIDLDVRDIADGTYQLSVEVVESARSLGAATLVITLHKNLDALVAELEAEAARAPKEIAADILYPIDRMRQVNRGQLELTRTFDPQLAFAQAQGIAAAARSGKNPFTSRTGDFKRHYLLQSAGEIMPYRMYVPRSYTGAQAVPLVVALHGVGGTEDYFFGVYDDKLPGIAEKHGYIVVAPMGYRVDGSYGWGIGNPPSDPVTRRIQERSEQDVMQVLELVKQQYKIDGQRIYLLGHSMGGIGTWKVAPKYPDIWAALAPISGSGSPEVLERIRHIPEIVVHGTADATVNVQGSRAMVAKMKQLGIEVTYIEVTEGTHRSVIGPNLDAIFTFFTAHRKVSAQN